MRVAGIVLFGVTLWMGGCSQPKMRASFESGTPSERTLAAVETARTGDTSNIPHLITMLGSGDAAQRMIAADALERLTGQTLGYHFADPEPRRREAIARWRQWHAGEVAPAESSS